MTVSFDKILTSRTFQFFIGPETPDRKPFTIHTAVLADLSSPLTVLMNGAMSEAANGAANLEDIEHQTFLKCCEYAYTGDYTPALNLNMSANTNPTDPVVVEEPLDTWGPSYKKKKSKKAASMLSDWNIREEPATSCAHCGTEIQHAHSRLWTDFQRRDYTAVKPRFLARSGPQDGDVVANADANPNPFLSHAQVYVFADRYDIAGLRILALDKLHKALCSVNGNGSANSARSQMGMLIDLIRFSYSNDNTRDNSIGEGIEGLRSMVVTFVVCWYKTFVAESGFLELMAEGGCFARDLAGLLGKRIDGLH